MVIAVCGKPGSGKTLFATYLLRKRFYQENGFFKRRSRKKAPFNNCYSNYPVNLYGSIFTNKVQLLDFKKFQKWKMDSVIVIDEVQSYFDSIEFKKIPRSIAMNMQFHRHFGIDTIYFLSQDPSRIPKVFRVLAQEWYQIINHFRIPFIGIAVFRIVIWNREEDYNSPSNLSRKERSQASYDYEKKLIFFRYKKVYKSYDTKYLKALIDDKEMHDDGTYIDLALTKEEIANNFPSINENYDIND